MATHLIGYYDHSHSRRDLATSRRRVLVLAGYAATASVWASFEADWRQTLQDDSSRPACKCLHMADAMALRGDFTKARGWSASGVQRLLMDLFNQCFAPRGVHREIEDALVGASCCVDLGGYDEVCAEFPHFKRKPAEALCVDHVVTVAIQQLAPGEERLSVDDLVSAGTQSIWSLTVVSRSESIFSALGIKGLISSDHQRSSWSVKLQRRLPSRPSGSKLPTSLLGTRCDTSRRSKATSSGN